MGTNQQQDSQDYRPAVGLATKLGIYSAALLAALAVIEPFLSQIPGNSQFYTVLATSVASLTVVCRSVQAAANAMKPVTTIVNGPEQGDVNVVPRPEKGFQSGGARVLVSDDDDGWRDLGSTRGPVDIQFGSSSAGAAESLAITADKTTAGSITSASVAQEVVEVDGDADADGPGDHFDLLPHIPVSDPSKIKFDEVDDTESGEFDAALDPAPVALFAKAASRARTSRTYRLSDKHRRTVDAIIKQGVEWMLANPSKVHYTQDWQDRWAAISKGLRIHKGQFLTTGDCSSTSTWLLKCGLYRAGFHPDVVNGQSWKAGYTGTMINHGRRVVHDSNLRFGDQIFYGDQGGGVPKHVAVYIGGGMVFSHGSDGGPYKLPIDYRSDRVAARRYY